MGYVVILLSAVCVYLGMRLYLQKKELVRIADSFEDCTNERNIEKHFPLLYTNKDLERLGASANKYLSVYYRDRRRFEKDLADTRNEITNLSHDLRTPLTSILGFVNLLEDEELTPRQKEYADVIRARSLALRDRINDLYDYSMYQDNTIQAEMTQVDLYRFLKETILTYYSELEENRIEIELSFPKKEEPVYIKGNEKYLARIFENLLGNSLKYSGGYLGVSLYPVGKHVMIGLRTRRGNLTEADVYHLFDRYYRKETGAVQKKMGTGLGLTIAKMLVEKMDGRIEATADSEYLTITCAFEKAE